MWNGSQKFINLAVMVTFLMLLIIDFSKPQLNTYPKGMRTIGNLLRGESAHSYRRTYGNANMTKRKDLRRLKKINIFNKQISGEQNSNTWFTPKRLKAMVHHIENMRNTHIGTNEIPKKASSEILEVMPKMAQYQYWNFRNRQQQFIEYQQLRSSCNLDEIISKMPAKFRDAIQSEQIETTPEIAFPDLRYNEQLQVYLPKDQRYRYNLIQKLRHPPKVKLEGSDLDD